MSESTPSQAEGEPEPTTGAEGEREQSGRRDAPRTTPSQAQGGDQNGDGDGEWESGWSGP
ncbi:hypothetical protein [Streptomyces sp. NPDC007206]|uniref:hypothetical protein n=1 Tax=Streptomyces sp. NPDC007206 TaxID=3154317 RepID=UPI0033F9F16F